MEFDFQEDSVCCDSINTAHMVLPSTGLSRSPASIPMRTLRPNREQLSVMQNSSAHHDCRHTDILPKKKNQRIIVI